MLISGISFHVLLINVVILLFSFQFPGLVSSCGAAAAATTAVAEAQFWQSMCARFFIRFRQQRVRRLRSCA